MESLKKTTKALLALTFGLLLLAVGSDPVSAQSKNHDVVGDSVQVVEITISEEGFAPEEIELEAGVPARLVFTRTTNATCAKQVQIPAFGIEKTEVPLNEPVEITFTPEEPGTFTFVCGLDMMEGAIVVES